MAGNNELGEFDIIRTLFRPLAGRDALNLADDTAWLSAEQMAVTKDLLVAGTHFVAGDPPDMIARKALRTNISDIVAKGARPDRYFLGLVLPWDCDDDWIRSFAHGLALDQEQYGLTLAGGDTTRHAGEGPLTISITMTGKMPGGLPPVLRSGARPDDLVAVTGTIGDAHLGLDVNTRRMKGNSPAHDFLRMRYLLPQPRTAFAVSLAQCEAHAAMDVSDGLIADAGHLAEASGVTIDLDLDRMPISPFARNEWADMHRDRAAALMRLASGGDDYEILLAAPAEIMAQLQGKASDAGTALTVIGRCRPAEHEAPVCVFVDDEFVASGKGGYDHFRR